VKQIRALVALLLVAVWLPASVHCLLEDAGWFPKDESCASAPPGTHCQEDGCQFEDGGVHFQAAKIIVPSCSFASPIVSFIAPPIPVHSLVLATESEILVKLAQGWQFSFRTALPVRAPSLFS